VLPLNDCGGTARRGRVACARRPHLNTVGTKWRMWDFQSWTVLDVVGNRWLLHNQSRIHPPTRPRTMNFAARSYRLFSLSNGIKWNVTMKAAAPNQVRTNSGDHGHRDTKSKSRVAPESKHPRPIRGKRRAKIQANHIINDSRPLVPSNVPVEQSQSPIDLWKLLPAFGNTLGDKVQLECQRGMKRRTKNDATPACPQPR